jgi:hypothetical protein
MLSYLHKVKENHHLWFVANSTDEPITAPITLAGKHTPEIWDPSNGQVEKIGFTHFEKEGSIFTEVRLVLPPVSALFLVSPASQE